MQQSSIEVSGAGGERICMQLCCVDRCTTFPSSNELSGDMKELLWHVQRYVLEARRRAVRTFFWRRFKTPLELSIWFLSYSTRCHWLRVFD